MLVSLMQKHWKTVLIYIIITIIQSWIISTYYAQKYTRGAAKLSSSGSVQQTPPEPPAPPAPPGLSEMDLRIQALGTSDDIKRYIGSSTQVIDAQGQLVIPGFIESHVHATGAARGEVTQPFIQLNSIGEIKDWVRASAREVGPGGWVQLPRVDVTRIREGRLPNQADLNEAAPNTPTKPLGISK